MFQLFTTFQWAYRLLRIVKARAAAFPQVVTFAEAGENAARGTWLVLHDGRATASEKAALHVLRHRFNTAWSEVINALPE